MQVINRKMLDRGYKRSLHTLLRYQSSKSSMLHTMYIAAFIPMKIKSDNHIGFIDNILDQFFSETLTSIVHLVMGKMCRFG